METKIEQIVNWIKEETEKVNAKGVVVRSSGGINSAIVVALAKKAFPQNIAPIWTGIETSKYARRNSNRVLLTFGLDEIKLDLKPIHEQFIKAIFELEILEKGDVEAFTKKMNGEELPKDMSYLELDNYQEISEDIRSELIKTTLYAWAKKENYLVLNNLSLSETYVGNYIKCGNDVGDLAPLANLTKTEIYQLAEEFELPKLVISTNKEEDENEDENEITYMDVDNFLANKEISEVKKTLIEKLHQKNLDSLKNVKKLN